MSLYNNRKGKIFLAHRLVTEHFIGNSPNLPCVNHKNEDTSDNSCYSLELCSFKYNNIYNNIYITRIDGVRNKCLNGKKINQR